MKLNKIKLYKKLEYLSYWFRYQATYLEMKYYLKEVLSGDCIKNFKKINYYDRGIGKSVALARLSAKYQIPIIVPNLRWKKTIEYDIPRELPKYFKKRKPIAISINTLSSKGKIKPEDILLIEERVLDEEAYANSNIKENPMVGYINLSKYI